MQSCFWQAGVLAIVCVSARDGTSTSSARPSTAVSKMNSLNVTTGGSTERPGTFYSRYEFLAAYVEVGPRESV